MKYKVTTFHSREQIASQVNLEQHTIPNYKCLYFYMSHQFLIITDYLQIYRKQPICRQQMITIRDKKAFNQYSILSSLFFHISKALIV